MFGPAVPVADGLQPQLMLIQVRPAVEPAMPLLLMCPVLPLQAYRAASNDKPLQQPSTTAPCDKRQPLLDLCGASSALRSVAQQSGSHIQLSGGDCNSPGGSEPLPSAFSGSMDTRGARRMQMLM